jgi:hypothetical protein
MQSNLDKPLFQTFCLPTGTHINPETFDFSFVSTFPIVAFPHWWVLAFLKKGNGNLVLYRGTAHSTHAMWEHSGNVPRKINLFLWRKHDGIKAAFFSASKVPLHLGSKTHCFCFYPHFSWCVHVCPFSPSFFCGPASRCIPLHCSCTCSCST